MDIHVMWKRIDPLYAACNNAGIRISDTHNEQAAAYVADAYARLTGRIGVCAVSNGIAHCNALTGDRSRTRRNTEI